VAVWHKGAVGVIVGNFTGTLVVFFVLLGYRRFQLGLEFDRPLFRQMQRFGLPLVPSGLALWAIDFLDRFFLLKLKNAAEVGLNFLLIPPYGMMGAASATLVAYVVMFLGMTVRAQQVFPVPYQWRRIALIVVAAVGLTVLGKSLHVPLAGAVALIAVYPLILLPLGFYLPVELRRLRALVLAR